MSSDTSRSKRGFSWFLAFASVATGVFLLTRSLATVEENWPRFRGEDATGVAPDNEGLPIEWSSTRNVSWIADVPGWGWSSPIVWQDKVFLTTVVSDKENLAPQKGLFLGQTVFEPHQGPHHWLVFCFDLKTGRELWKHEAHTAHPEISRHRKSTYASETATTAGQRVYVLFGDLGLYCYDMDGKQLWSQPIQPRETIHGWGAAASPVVHDGQVFVVYDNMEESWIASFDAQNGSERWQLPRDETYSWATPFVWKNEFRTEIVVLGARRIRSYSPNGHVLWDFDGLMSNIVIASPFAAHGLCYVASGKEGDRQRPTLAIKPGGVGDIAPNGVRDHNEFIAWYQPRSGPYSTSQIVYGDYLYTCYDGGFVTCHNAKTGERVYGRQRFTPGGSFTSSPFAYNGHLFFLSEDGLTYVVKAGPEFEIVARNDLGELCMACPAIVGSRLLIRTASKLYCMTKGAEVDGATIAKMQPIRSAQSYSDIWSAASEGDIKGIERLLISGTDVNAVHSNGSTALDVAAFRGHTEVAELLIRKGANVTIANADGNTALHTASVMGNPEIVALLLDHGASDNAKNKLGKTPLDLVSAS